MAPPIESDLMRNKNKHFNTFVESLSQSIYVKLFVNDEAAKDGGLGYSEGELIDFATKYWESFANDYIEKFCDLKCLEDKSCEKRKWQIDMVKNNSGVIVREAVEKVKASSDEVIDRSTRTPYYFKRS